MKHEELIVKHSVKLNCECLVVDGEVMAKAAPETRFLTELYHKFGIDYPKFFKMDALCKAGFIASEALLASENVERFLPRNDRAIILFNKWSSLKSDKDFSDTISNRDDFFPKPAVFVYTLPNIVTGEIAIRNRYQGESELFVLGKKDSETMEKCLERAFLDTETKSVLTGWLDATSETDYEAELYIIEKK